MLEQEGYRVMDRLAAEVASAIAQDLASVVEHEGRITGYTTGVGFIGHGIGMANDDVKALIASADEFAGPGILIPTGNNELFTWCLDHGLRVVQQMTLMDTAPTGSARTAPIGRLCSAKRNSPAPSKNIRQTFVLRDGERSIS